MRAFTIVTLLALAIPFAVVSACGVGEDGTASPCFFMWTDSQGGRGSVCDNNMESEAECKVLVDDVTAEGKTVANWAYMPECATAGCTGTCTPSWWRPY